METPTKALSSLERPGDQKQIAKGGELPTSKPRIRHELGEGVAPIG